MSENKIFVTDDGSHSLFSDKYGVSYHSKFGALQETRHIFIDAALRFKAVLQRKIHILETGFGTGLNAYITYLEALRRNLKISYTGVDAYPISLEQARLLNYPELIPDVPEALPFLHLHELSWEETHKIADGFKLRKRKQRFEEIEEEEAFDIIYFDAFAPEAQPEVWASPMLERMYRAMKKDGVLVTYCAKGVVKRRMKNIGFEVEAIPGPPGKREMTRAHKP